MYVNVGHTHTHTHTHQFGPFRRLGKPSPQRQPNRTERRLSLKKVRIVFAGVSIASIRLAASEGHQNKERLAKISTELAMCGRGISLGVRLGLARVVNLSEVRPESVAGKGGRKQKSRKQEAGSNSGKETETHDGQADRSLTELHLKEKQSLDGGGRYLSTPHRPPPPPTTRSLPLPPLPAPPQPQPSLPKEPMMSNLCPIEPS